MRKFAFFVALAVFATLPGFYLRLTGTHVAPGLEAAIFFVAILAAGFLLSWGAEAAEQHVSQGLIIGVLALVTVLPEYAVDLYYTYQAGLHPGSAYAGFAAANMTGANRLLIGVAWPLVAGIYWWRSRRQVVELHRDNSAEIAYLTLASLYAFVIVLKNRIDLVDFVVLVAIFAAYLWRLGKLPKTQGEAEEEPEEVGPAAAVATLSTGWQWAVMGGLTLLAVTVVVAAAEPFAEALLASGKAWGVSQFLLVQWVAPLASETPGVVLVVLFVLNLRPKAALSTLVSDKINQWTLLVGMIPLAYALGAGRVLHFELDARQHEEFFLTAAQSLFAVALLLRLPAAGAVQRAICPGLGVAAQRGPHDAGAHPGRLGVPRAGRGAFLVESRAARRTPAGGAAGPGTTPNAGRRPGTCGRPRPALKARLFSF
jgi:cation:H+ antiporter